MANEKSTKETKTVKTNTQPIIIAILSTVLVCAVVVFVVLICTGVIKFGNDTPNVQPGDTTGQTIDNQPTQTTTGIIDNPNPRIKVKDAILAKVGDFEFYLPDDFEAGGKNSDGAYTYNLTDDDGWAQALVYAEKTSLTPEQYLNKISSYLDITNKNYQMNGTTWVQGENANALAYATKLDDTIYAVYYAIKLDSDDATEAMSMIPKTLYMAKVYAK